MSTLDPRRRFVLSRNVLFIVMAMACAGRLAAQSSSFQVLTSFSGPPNGFPPAAQLTQGSDGNFYGVTELGGNANAGTVFKITPAGVLTPIYSFTGGAGGASPEGALTQGSDGNFYGTTNRGGDSNGDGTVFKITPAGVLTTLHTFSGTDGKYPGSGLTLGTDGNFYGTTVGDQGATGYGTVFQITPDGVLTNLYSFAGGADGRTPLAGLTLGNDGDFYGTTSGIGPGISLGTIFKITTGGTLTTVHSFTGGAGGSSPVGGVTLGRDGNFYGATSGGGDLAGDGTIFQLTQAGVFTTLCNFAGGAGGSDPVDGLTQGYNGSFYGTTYGGGDRNNDGTVFQVMAAGILTTLYTFTGGADGSHPAANLALGVDGNFYGTTEGGGISNANGAIFKITPSGVFTALYTFTGASDGAVPVAGLTLGADGNLYGTTNQGGIGSGHGTVFQITPAGALTSLYAFSGGADGAVPAANLTLGSNGNFYGVTSRGGNINNFGTVFEITPAGALTTLHTFAGNADGGVPAAGLTLGSDGNFYGTTSGGGDNNGDGTVFQITSAGVLTSLSAFSLGTTGSTPLGELVQGSDGNFYGTTEKGGSGNGTVFQVTPAGVLNSLYSFPGLENATPVAGLVQGSDGSFYGTTEKGGTGSGTVFAITPAGVLTNLYTFTGGSDGAFLMDNLTLGSDGNFYGTTSGGGDSNGDGTVFQITPAGVLTTVYTFSGTDGSNPRAGLTLGNDGNFYGTTASGGQNGLGVIFFLTLSAPVITSDTAVVQVNTNFRFQIVASNRPSSFGASNLPAGLTVNASTGLISGIPTQSGAFSVGISASNAVGTGSGTLALTVSPAPVQQPVVTSDGASAKVGAAFSFQIAATNNPTGYAATNLPLGLSVDATTGLISGTPTQNGTFIVSLSATNSAGTGAGTLTLTVSPTAPAITSALTASGQAGQPFSYQIAGSNTPTSFGASGLPAGLSVDLGAGLISGTPSVSGTFSVTISVANSGGTGNAVLTLTVAPNPVPAVTLVATVPKVVAGSGKRGKFTLTLPAPAVADLAVAFKIKGTAINGVDYRLLKGTVTIAAGSTSKVIKIVPTGDLEGASSKTVALQLKPGNGYTVGTAGKVRVKILSATGQ